MEGQAVIEAVEPIVRDAGDILLSYFRQVITRNYKTDGSFVTRADIESEQFLIKHLKNIIPGAGFFAEESGKVPGNKYCWVIDPLDGTTNFAQGLPYFCSSVALTKNNEPIVGIVFQPLLNEMFIAIKGGGAFLNGVPIKVSSAQTIEKSVILFALPYEDNPPFFKTVCQLEKQAYSSRTFGAAALDQAYCAAGKGDVVLIGNLSWWDIAAGMLLITEAGGIIEQFDGSPITPLYRSFIGGNKTICNTIGKVITDL